MSAASTLHTFTPYPEAATDGPNEFVADGSIDSGSSGSPVRRPGLLLRATLILTVLLAAATSFAQVGREPRAVVTPVKAHLSSTLFEKTIATGFMQPEQIAMDSQGNLYIADILTNNVYKETPVNGVYTQSIFRANLCGPEGVAVDGNGDVFIANSDCGQILEETLLPDGKYFENTIPTSGLGGIICELAANSTGTVLYIADCFNKRVVVEGLSLGEWSQSVLPLTGLSFPQGLALTVDGEDLFIADTDNNSIVEWNVETRKQSIAVSSGLNAPVQVFAVGIKDPLLYIADTLNDRIVLATYNSTAKAYQTRTVSTGSLNAPTGVAADSAGDVFIADTNNKRLIEDSTGINTDFGAWPIGQKSTTATLTFTFDSGGKIGAPAIGTTNSKAALFFSKSTGSCAKGATFATGKTCTIEVYFEGQLPGFYYGTADLKDFSGNLLAPADIGGTGVGPLPVYPSTVANSTAIGTGLKSPAGVAIDLSGNTYICDPGNKQVLKVAPSVAGHTTTQSVVVEGSALSAASWIAVDSVGDVFINEASGGVIEETPAAGGTYTQTTVYGKSVNSGDTLIPGPIVVDRSDNVWIAFKGYVQEYTLVSGAWKTGSRLAVTYLAPSATEAVPLLPISLAVDGRGNFYVGEAADSAAHLSKPRIVRYAGSGEGLVVESGTVPQALAADAIGNVWVADNDARLYSFSPVAGNFVAGSSTNPAPPSSITYTQNAMWQRSTLKQVSQLAANGLAQILIANTGEGQVLNAQWNHQASVGFPTLQVDTTSSPEGEVIYNLGNGDMNLVVPSTGQNPSLSSGPFALETSESDACPVLTSSSEPAALAAGEECQANVTFAPTAPGNFNATLAYKYEGPNATQPSVSFQLQGTAIQPIPTITWPAPAAISYGTPLSATQLNATATYNGQTVPGTFTYLPPLGTVLVGGTEQLQLTFNPTDSAQFSAATVFNKIQVNPVPLVIVADSFSQTYGSPIPAFTASYIGFVNGDTPASLRGSPIITTEATPLFPWGYYPITITQGSLSSPNYTFSLFVDGTLVITQAPLTVTANNVTVANSGNIPNPYPCTISGFVNGDTAAVVSGACATNAQNYSSSPTGTYTVSPTVGTLSALNYTFDIFANGTLTLSGSQSVVTIGSGFYLPEAVAVDANGNVYVADAEEYFIVKETLANGTFTQSDIEGTPASQFGIAVDGSGNLYVTASESNQVWEWTYSNGAYTSSIIADSDSGINNPWGIAVDKNGNVFVANFGSSNVIELKPVGSGEFALSTIANSSDEGLNSPEGIAVDGNGNVYICDSGNERVVIMNNSGGKYTMSGTTFGPFDQLTGVAVDTNGNVYISAATESTVYKETLSNGTYTQSQFPANGLSAPGGVAVDANGNVYIANTGLRNVLEVPAASSQSAAKSLAVREIKQAKLSQP
jgi:hypothetical protein